jgi:hypothetical protein
LFLFLFTFLFLQKELFYDVTQKFESGGTVGYRWGFDVCGRSVRAKGVGAA